MGPLKIKLSLLQLQEACLSSLSPMNRERLTICNISSQKTSPLPDNPQSGAEGIPITYPVDSDLYDSTNRASQGSRLYLIAGRIPRFSPNLQSPSFRQKSQGLKQKKEKKNSPKNHNCILILIQNGPTIKFHFLIPPDISRR